MPFDSTGFPPGSPDPGKPRPGNAATVLIIIVSAAALLTPVSLAACIDIIRALSR